MDLSKQSNDYEIVDFMIERFKRVTGIGQPKKKRATPVQQLQEADPDEYISGL